MTMENPVFCLSDLKYRFRRASEEERQACLDTYWKLPPACGNGLPHYLDAYAWWIHPGDLRIPGGLRVDQPLIVLGDLIIDGDYHDHLDGLMAVFGSLHARHVFSRSGLFVARDLLLTGLNYQYYNDWVFECAGRVVARAFIGDDKDCGISMDRLRCEGYYHSHSGEVRGLAPLTMLGLADEAENGFSEVVGYVADCESRGESPFVVPAPPPEEPWQEVLRPETSPARLAALAESHPWAAALHPHLPPALQAQLARRDDPRVRWALAGAAGVSEEILALLGQDDDARVRAAVAAHPRCPESLWPTFARDPASQVRAAVVHAHGAGPAAWVPELAADPAEEVRRAVAVVPGLPDAVVAALLEDADAVVKNRTLRIQGQPPHVLRAQFDSPDKAVRLSLARAAAYGEPPFGAPEQEALRAEALARFMLDDSPEVREAAATTWLSPRFYEAHGARFVTDEVTRLRRCFASVTREATWLDRLADDPDDDVRGTVASNPNTPAATLARLLARAQADRYEERNLPYDLLKNPKLPAALVAVIYDQVIPDGSLEPHPNAPVPTMLSRIMGYAFSCADQKDRATFARCQARLETAQPGAAGTWDALFNDIFKAKPNYLLDHALGNAACPPALLARYVGRYLRRANKSGWYEMADVAGNPSLARETQEKLTAYLLAHHDHELLKGIARNPGFAPDLLAALALGAPEGYSRWDMQQALWKFHGLTQEDLATLPPAQLQDVAWLDAPDAEDLEDASREVDEQIAQANRMKEEGDYQCALDILEATRAEVAHWGEEGYRPLYIDYLLLWLHKQLVFHTDTEVDDELDEEEREATKAALAARLQRGRELAEGCLARIVRHAIMPFSPLGELETETLRYAQNYLAWDAVCHHAEDIPALEAALERIDDALNYARPGEDDYLHATRAHLLVLLQREAEIDFAGALAALRHDPFEPDLGEMGLRALEKLVVEFPDQPRYWAALGDVRAFEEDNPGALAAYAEAVRLLGKENLDDGAETGCSRAGVFACYGESLLRAGAHAKARTALNTALRLSPGYAYALACRCRLFLATGDMDKALKDAQALVRSEEHSDHYVLLAQTRLRCGELEACIEAATSAIERDDTAADAYLVRSQALLEQGHLEAALEDADQAVQCAPEEEHEPGYYYHRGLVHYRIGQLERAEADYARACELAADAPQPFYGQA